MASVLLVTYWFHRRVHSANHHLRRIASPLLPGEWVFNGSSCVFYDEELSSDTRPLLMTTDKHLIKLPVQHYFLSNSFLLYVCILKKYA